MTGGHAVNSSGGDQIRIKREPDIAGGLFQVALQGWNIGVADVEREPEIAGQAPDEFGIRDRSGAPNPMLDVDHAQQQVPTRSQFSQCMQQEHRIGAAGHGHAHPVPRREHAMLRDELGYAVQHSSA